MDESVVKYLKHNQDLKHNQVADLLRRAKALISDPEKWARGAFEHGERRCAVNALSTAVGIPCDRAGPADYAALAAHPATRVLHNLLEPGHGGRHLGLPDAHQILSVICRFNNISSHQDVMAALDRAIEIAEEVGETQLALKLSDE